MSAGDQPARTCWECRHAGRYVAGLGHWCDWAPPGWPHWAVAELRGGWNGNANKGQRSDNNCPAFSRKPEDHGEGVTPSLQPVARALDVD